jgi:hypothetical protein
VVRASYAIIVGKSASHCTDGQTQPRSAFSSSASILSIFQPAERDVLSAAITVGDYTPDCAVGVDMTVIHAYDKQYYQDTTASELTTIDDAYAIHSLPPPPSLLSSTRPNTTRPSCSGTDALKRYVADASHHNDSVNESSSAAGDNPLHHTDSNTHLPV